MISAFNDAQVILVLEVFNGLIRVSGFGKHIVDIVFGFVILHKNDPFLRFSLKL